jgi:penicillin-binding protein 1C
VGYQAASCFYFGVRSEHLTWGQAAILAVLPNAPGLISPRKNHDVLIAKRNSLLGKLRDRKIISRLTYDLAVLEDVSVRCNRMPMKAPHFARWLSKIHGRDGVIIHSTIRSEIQEYIEGLVHDYGLFLGSSGIHNCAALVVETASGKVRSYVGSNDFFDSEHCGQIDGVRAARSSGSILKPFLYALAMDEGMIHPRSMIKDVPSRFGSYAPANADQKHSGLVSAHDALVRSLNVPAVRLLHEYGIHSFFSFLKSAGMTTLFRSSDDYGLPLILGGAETTLFDLAVLYRGLGNGGRFSPLHVCDAVVSRGMETNPGEEFTSSGRDQMKTANLISSGACYLTLNILRELKRPGAEFYWEQYQNQWPLAWKTGTSYGHRDAWAVGVSPSWTIAVWVGNFSGEANGGLGGARCAGPLLFDIFNCLPKDASNAWFQKPEHDLKRVRLCLDTGFTADEHCPDTVLDEAPAQMRTLASCPYHRSIFVSKDERFQVCSLCWKSGCYKKMRVLALPPDVAQFMRESGQAVDRIPPHKSTCSALADQRPLQILYPTSNARLWVPRDLDGTLQKVAARAAHSHSESLIYWYIDDVFLGSSEKHHSKALDLSKGWHVLEIVDKAGNRDHTRFYVDMKRLH